jgi:2-keto-3-deoxy-L-rhamnonate aldolase RhmA
MPRRLNPLIGMLEAGGVAVGAWTSGWSSPRIAKVVATAGADFIVADMEHDVYDLAMMQRFMLQVSDFAQRFGQGQVPPILVKLGHRAAWDPRYEIAEMLRIGPAMGIWIPFVESAGDLQRALSAARRSEGFAHAGLNLEPEQRDVWPLNPRGEYFAVGMIESEAGVDKAEEILATPGLGGIEIVHVSEAAEAHVLALCGRFGVIPAVTAPPEEVPRRLAQGYRLISVGWDHVLLAQALSLRLADTRRAVRQLAAPGA